MTRQSKEMVRRKPLCAVAGWQNELEFCEPFQGGKKSGRVHRRERWRPRGAATKAAPEKGLGRAQLACGAVERVGPGLTLFGISIPRITKRTQFAEQRLLSGGKADIKAAQRNVCFLTQSRHCRALTLPLPVCGFDPLRCQFQARDSV